MPSPPSRIAQTPAGILFDARATRVDDKAPIVGGTWGPGGGPALESAVNSGNEASGFHSWVPPGWTGAWALIRPSASQLRIWSAPTGPYCRRSAPMILYIMHLYRSGSREGFSAPAGRRSAPERAILPKRTQMVGKKFHFFLGGA